MAETSKKNPRKSKLVHRDCVEIDEVKDAASKLQILVHEPEASTSLLPKIRNTINEDFCIDHYQSPVKFSVEVEVEEFEEDKNIRRPTKRSRRKNKPELEEIVLPTETIKEEIFKLMQTTTSTTDKLVEMEICNTWGKYINPPEKDEFEVMVQSVLTQWKFWVGQSKNRAFILAYKCYVCSIGWWNLGPFFEHIKIHKDISVKLETFHQECFIVAACGEWFENMCQVLVEGICPLCLKTYEQHLKQKKDGLYYVCDGCQRPFPTCKLLFEHEGLCFKFAKIAYENVIPVEGQAHCKLCGVICLTELRYTGHMAFYHSPRSDVSMMAPLLKDCHHCGLPYIMFHLHICAKKASNFMCGFCCRRYQNTHMLQIHRSNTQADFYCKICNKYLKKRCMEMEHVVNHSREYMSVYKCLDCLDNVLVPDLPSLSSHRVRWHGGRKADRRRGYYELMLVPRVCMSKTASNEYKMTASMVIDKKTSVVLMDVVAEKNKGLVVDSVIEKTFRRQEYIAMQADEDDIRRITKHITDTMLQRIQSKKSVGSESEASQSPKPVDDSQNAIGSLLPDQIKKEKDDETWTEVNENDNLYQVEGIDDEDINETESSVNALLGIINIKKEVEIKQEIVDQDIDIEEQDLSHFITIEDSQESWSGVTVKNEVLDTPDEVIVERKDTVDRNEAKFGNNGSKHVVSDIITIEDSEDDLEDVIVKNEISNTYIEENNKQVISNAEFAFAEGNFETEVEIKDEQEDYTEFDENELEREQSACLKELSKVFQVSKSGTVEISGICVNEEDQIKEEPMDEEECLIELSKVFQVSKSGTVKLSGICVNEQDQIKEEPMDEDEYEDDIIVLNDSGPLEFQTLTTSETLDPDNSNKSDKEASSDTDPAKLKPNVEEPKALFSRILKNYQEIRLHKDPAKLKPNLEEPKAPYSRILRNNQEIRLHKDPAKLKPNIEEPKAPFSRILKNYQEIRLHKKKLYHCTKCNFTGVFREYKVHITTVCPRNRKGHKNEWECPTLTWSDIKCSQCSTKFTTVRKYLEHYCIKHYYKPVTCPQCGKTFKLMHSLAHHVSKHIKATYKKLQVLRNLTYITTRNSGLYQCKVCDEEVYLNKFFTHWEMHMTDKSFPDQNYDSDEIPEKQRTETSDAVDGTEAFALQPEIIKKILAQLLQPLEKRNKTMAPYDKRCVYCAHVFERRNDCKRHLVEHLLRDAFAAAAFGGELECQQCGQTFPKPTQFKEHMRCHGSLPVFRCEMCDKAFSDSSNFAKHKKVHNVEVLVCDLCKKKFQAKKSLEQHMQLHRLVGPVSCLLCRREFESSAMHRRHMRTAAHSKGTPRFLCAFCRERFTSVKAKWDHMWEVHKHRSSNADCPVCNESFRKFQDVRLHMREVHGMSVMVNPEKGCTALLAKGETGQSGRYKSKLLKSVRRANIEALIIYKEGNNT